ncbi:arsenate reductase [Saccharopolyspora flava]|uniref:Arsenate reductase n=1 Tax=Saccharopolyspora flava TaxID=95161 RepID=A0A1I6TEL2_9PSEU|nr:arsenate reductase [Saccharopolyspora flava]
MNPACSKCRSAVSELDAAGAEYTVRRYLEEPPTVGELEAVLERLGLEPWDIARTGEAVAKEIGLRDVPKDAEHRGEWLRLMSENPKLVQRPIITASDSTTVVGRDPESVRRVIEAERDGARP